MGEDYIDQLLASGQEPEDLTQIVSSNSAPVTQPTWEPLAQQISQQWQQYGINPDIKGINRANELAQILYNYGITDLSKLGIRQTPYEEMRGSRIGQGEDAQYIEELYKGNRGQLTYGDQTFGRLGGFGSGGEKEFAAPQEFLTEAGNGRYGLGYSAAGKGWTDYEVVVKPDGTPVIVPRWGSSSDIDPELVQFLSIAAMPFTSGLSSALASAGLGAVGGQIAAQALISGGLGGLSSAAQGEGFGKGFGRGAVAGGLGAAAAPYLGNLGSAASDIVGGGNLGEIVSGAVKGAGQSAVGAAVTGSSIGDALLTGAAGGAAGAGADLFVKGTNSTLGQYLKDVPAPIRDSVLAAAGAGILGKDPSKAAVNALISSAMKGAKGGPSGQAASAGYGGADLGFFDPEAEALAQEDIQSIVARYPEAGNLPSWALDPYKDETVDWASLYAQPTTNPATGQTIVGAAQSGYPAQTFGTAPQSDINAVYDSIVRDRGGFASTWQTVGSDRVMVQDDGSAIGINTETGENYGLTPEETKRMVDAGLLNTAASGYNAAIGKSPGSAPAGKTPSKTPSKQDPYKQAMDTLALMQGQRPEEEEYELFSAKPFGYELMYGLRG